MLGWLTVESVHLYSGAPFGNDPEKTALLGGKNQEACGG